MPFLKKYVLMDKAGDEGGAGGGGGAQPTLEDLQKQLAEATSSIQKLTEKNKELINEKQAAAKKAEEAARAAAELEKKKAEESNEPAKLLSIVQKELEEKTNLLKDFETKEEQRRKENEYAEKLSAFKEDLKEFKFKNEKHVEEIFKSRFADKYVKEEDKWNKEGRSQAKKEFLKEYDYLVDTSRADLEQETRRRDSDHSTLQKEINEVFKRG